jgi:hypothetical protein
MKKQLMVGLAVLTVCQARAAYDFTGGSIPDSLDGGLVGVSFSGVISGLPSGYDLVSDLKLTFNITGGYNHDLYAHLVSPNGTLVELFNQPGSLYSSGSGFSVTLGHLLGPSIQTAGQTENQVLSGNYAPSGSFTAFDGGTANGTWTLFFQDLSQGGGASTLNGWSLDLTAVPEPTNVALGVFAALGGVVGLVRWRVNKKG